MNFASIPFLFFILPVVLVYWKVPKKYQSWFLLIASYVFVSSLHIWFALLLGVTTLISYGCAILMDRKIYKKFFFLVALVFLFAQLFIFKYLGFFESSVSTLSALFSVKLSFPVIHLLIPLGLSFYTFQSVGYLIDIYTGKSKLERQFDRFALFVSFFPTIASGPIERGDHLIPQFQHHHRFEYARVVSGLQLFTLGLFKKLVIADNLGVIVDSVFSSLHLFRGLSLVVTMVFFSWQLYYDFSGYSDMARGIAKILGFDILENFKTPYLASSVQDFWRRWHISLSNWFRDYLYFPLGGSRKGQIRTMLNVCLVFTICGLWHGAALTFLIWGALHGLLLTGERIGRSILHGKFHIPSFISIPYTYVVVTVTWVFFRSPSLVEAEYILKNSLVGVSNFVKPQYLFATLSQLFHTNIVEMIIGMGILSIGIFLELASYQSTQANSIVRLPKPLRFVFYTASIVAILMLRQADIAKFIYIQF